jgi:hypothetical protein
MLAGEARRIDSDWLPFLGIHRNPESSPSSLDDLG